YSTERPRNTYAALIGQAILSAKDHRLTLKEIYQWISVVYPYFNLAEGSWIDSIRHVLSTNAHFRKVTRPKGSSHWAIFDSDLDCFLDGGYRKPGAIARQGGDGSKKRSPCEVLDGSRMIGAKRSKRS
ncbi:hypothetical protein B0H11DRAFT_1677418, partial [Mycena galericulata]